MKSTGRGARVTGAALFLGLATVVAGACANGGETETAGTSAAASAEQPSAGEVAEPSEGSGLESQGGPVDMELAVRGEELFTRKGCVACHKIGEGRLVGPDLMGVTERRSQGWIFAMITAPDSMLRSDPTAKDLFAEYFTPMPDQKVGPDEARALYEYLRARTEGAMQSSSATGTGANLAMAAHHTMAAHHHRRAAAMGGGPARQGPDPATARGQRHRHHHRTSP